MQFLTLFFTAAVATSAAAQASFMDILASNNKTLGTLMSFIQSRQGLINSLNNARDITFLAPSNDAFSKFLSTPAGQAASNNPEIFRALLEYHVLQGIHRSEALNTNLYAHSLLINPVYTRVTNGQVVELSRSGKRVRAISGNKEMSMSTTTDVMFAGGVIHVIDKVLTIPMPPSRAALDSSLTGFAGALASANIVPAVDNARDLTIFAPSNRAFELIGSALPGLKADRAMLRNVLAYHLVNGTVYYSGMFGKTSLKTAQGGQVNVEVANNKAFVNSARVIISDVIVSNGVVHVLDNVLNPANPGATPIPTATTQTVAYAGVTPLNIIPFTAGIVPTTTAPSASTSTAGAGRVEGAMGMAALFGVVAVAVL